MKNNHLNDSDKLKEAINHGNISFNLAVHLTECNVPMDIMLYTHWHEEFELLYIADGSMELHIDSASLTVEKGHIIMISPELIHGATRKDDSSYSFYAIVFHPLFINSAINDLIQTTFINPFLSGAAPKYININKTSKDYEKALDLVNTIINLNNAQAYGYELLTKAHILQIFYYLLELEQPRMNTQTPDDILTTLRIKKILTYLDENYQHPISLTDWASCINLSKEQFCRIFKKHFNKTPISYLQHYRLNKALDLLRHSTMPIIDIAFETGFESANYFSIFFKSVIKCTPKEFRNGISLVDIT